MVIIHAPSEETGTKSSTRSEQKSAGVVLKQIPVIKYRPAEPPTTSFGRDRYEVQYKRVNNRAQSGIEIINDRPDG